MFVELHDMSVGNGQCSSGLFPKAAFFSQWIRKSPFSRETDFNFDGIFLRTKR